MDTNQANQAKEILGVKAKRIIADGLRFKINKSGKVCCPIHADKEPSMSWFNNGLMWRCHACNENIDIYRYYTEFEKMSFTDAVKNVCEMVGVIDNKTNNFTQAKTFILPQIELRELSQEAIDLMEVRKINKETLDAWKVKESDWKNEKVYVFQYFDGEQREYVSYRQVKKGGFKGGCEYNTKSILWGMWHVDKTKPLVITEGQPDAMVVWQSGYKNVVSVPSGSSNFAWVDNCWEWLKDVKEIIVFADNDKAGLKFADEVKTKFANVKIVVSENRKDANEVLFYDGAEKVLRLITDAIKKMPNGLIDVSELDYKSLLEQKDNAIETGFFEYDSHVEDWKEEELTVVVGRNGEGKTTFMSQVIAHCLEKKVKTFLYSGEMSDNKIQSWLYRQLIGNHSEYLYDVQTKYKIKTEINADALRKIKEWHRDTLYLFDRNATDVAKDMNSFFELMELAAKRYSVKLFIIDNLMSKLEERADSLNSDQANFVQRCKDFVINNKCHLVLLVHPNKGKEEIKAGVNPNIEKTDISGTNNIANKADNIISIERNWNEEREYDAVITSLKDRETGERKAIKYCFSKRTLRFYNDTTKEEKVYGWMKKDEEPEWVQTAIDGSECPF
jgi:twinkle protein